ncbi:MAG: peptide ABC transporter permease [Rhodospirillaceae bacterium]|nr:peptide ABC transporter permease [Rhodospirillaceae bacterium]OUT76552.1 MAG: peptide ABC transporter permease [Rhodospirillaceae bacterium TMED23]|tara:strand:- start:6509 stop:7627 length:1119 start_codon:yes stop_codon:yes gene_type:complete
MFNPNETQELTPEQERFYMASQWKMMWWRLKRHRIAVLSGSILVLMYVSILFTEFLATYSLPHRHTDHIFAPPQSVQFFNKGQFVGPFVLGLDYNLNLKTLRREYTPNPDKVQKLRFICHGDTYKLWGLYEMDLHFICPAPGGTFFFLGTDRLGRDIWSRIIYGARISLTVGLIGIAISFFLGLTIGGAAGFFGGWVDNLAQRSIEILRSIPELPLWMGLSAAMPEDWSPLTVFFGLTIILGLVDWPGLARAVRSKLLSLREEDFCTAATLMGAKPRRVIARHLLPNFMSHLIASATLSIPSMILAETALSFLGLGLRPPVTSWGVLLVEAQNFQAVAVYPWLLFPAIPVIITVLAFNFFGDGLRDAADPYK